MEAYEHDFRQAFVRAADRGDIQAVKELLEAGADVNVMVKARFIESTALIRAAGNGHIEVVELLLQAKADPNKKNASGETALGYALRSNHLNIMEVLIDRGAQVDLAENSGFTPLRLAANTGRSEAAEVLLKKGADVDATGVDGITALSCAEKESRSAFISEVERKEFRQIINLLKTAAAEKLRIAAEAEFQQVFSPALHKPMSVPKRLHMGQKS